MNYIKIHDDATNTTSELLDECRALFPVWSWFDDKTLDKDFPKPKKATTRWFQNIQEADEDLKSKSANDLESEKIDGITLRERILFELAYFKETGKPLDVDNITLCSGSRYADGRVPGAGWDDGEFDVYAYVASSRLGTLRSRRAFVSDPSNFKLEPSSDLESRVVALEKWKDGFIKALGNVDKI